MIQLEVMAHWSAAGAYAVATLLAGLLAAIRRQSWLPMVLTALVIGVMAHTLALVARWIGSGHGPYLGRYEAFSSHALLVAVVFLAAQWRLRAIRDGAAAVTLVVFLLLGFALLAPAAPTYPSPAMRGPWLVIHISVAKLALATTVVMGAAGLAGLWRRGTAHWQEERDAPPDQVAAALLRYTFFLMTVTLLSGSLWASAAWGSYWNWDPVETWSLGFWLACAFVLHLRSGGQAARGAWAGWIVALAALGLLTFVGYGHFGPSIHAGYIAP